MAFLSRCDLFPAERASISFGTLLFRRARFGRRAALHPALNHGFLLPRDEHCGDVRRTLVLRLAHRDAVDGHADQPGLPHLPPERTQRRRVFFRADGELGEDASRAVEQEMSDIALAMAHANERRRGKPS